MLNCSECGYSLEPGYLACPGCGEQLESRTASHASFHRELQTAKNQYPLERILLTALNAIGYVCIGFAVVLLFSSFVYLTKCFGRQHDLDNIGASLWMVLCFASAIASSTFGICIILAVGIYRRSVNNSVSLQCIAIAAEGILKAFAEIFKLIATKVASTDDGVVSQDG